MRATTAARTVLAVGLLAACLAVGLACSPTPGTAPTQPQPADSARPRGLRPNIVLVLTDDEDVALHAFMPKTKALLHERGTTFDNAFVTYPLCCPSRATLLRGQYPHSTSVQGNAPPLGGYQTFHALGRDSSTIATWLHAAGYRTAMLGKYLNGYQPRDGVPPGWTEWYVGGNAYRGYDYTLNENGALISYGSRPEDFIVDVLARKAAEIIRRSAAERTPFFLYIAPYTPHGPATAAPRHEGVFADAVLPRSPAFDEEDVNDKPAGIRRRERLNARQVARMTDVYRRRLQSLQSVDDLVERLVTVLDSTGQLPNTYIFYTSDNGFHLGEHRLVQGKNTPYEPDIRVPLVVRGPDVTAGRREGALVLNNDLAPTFAAIAGVPAPAFVEGRSLLPLLTAPAQPWTRAGFMVERRVGSGAQAGDEEPDDTQVRGAQSFNAIRTRDYTYVEYGSGERELYDLRRDPHQLQNLIGSADTTFVRRLSSWLADLARCSGPQCRNAEDAEPPRMPNDTPKK